MSVDVDGRVVRCAYNGIMYNITTGWNLKGFWIERNGQVWYFKRRFDRDYFNNAVYQMQKYTIRHYEEMIDLRNEIEDDRASEEQKSKWQAHENNLQYADMKVKLLLR